MKMKRAGWLVAAGVLLVSGAAIAAALTYQTLDWLFNSSLGTAFDNTKIEIAAGNARLLSQTYTRTQNKAPGTAVTPMSAPPAAVDTEGFNGTLTNLAWSGSRLELGAMKASNMLAGLQALWHFDDGLSDATAQTLADDFCSGAGCTNIGNDVGNRGTNSTSEPAIDPVWVLGPSGGALSFNGATYAMATLNFGPSAIAAAAWVKFDDLTGEQTLVAKQSYQGSTPQCYRLYKNTSNRLVFETDVRGYDAIGTLRDNSIFLTSTTTVSANTWYHVVGTFENIAAGGGTGQLYVNGVLEYNSNGGAWLRSAWFNTSTNPTYFGRNALGTYLKGTLDEVALFNTRLTAAAAAALAQRAPEGYYTSNAIRDTVSLLNNWKTLSWTEGPVTGLGEPGLPNDTWGLTANYHFDEGAGGTALDAICSGGTCTNTTSQDGWINGGPFYTAPGLAGPYALQFFGAGAVQLPNDPAVKPANQMTVEMWVKPSALAGVTQHLISTKSQNGSFDAYGLYMNFSGPYAAANSWVFWNTRNTNVISYPTLPLLPSVVGSWTHIAGTYDGNCSNIYVNGVQGTPVCTGSAPLGYSGGSPVEVFIGRKSDNTSNFQGTIDEVAIYNTVLPLATIQQHAMQGLLNLQMRTRTSADGTAWTPWQPAGTALATGQAGLAALWHLDDGTSGTSPQTLINAVTGLAYGQLGSLSTSDASDPQWVTSGNTANALSFDGVDDLVTVPDSTAVSPTTAMTLEAWINPTSLVAGRTLFTKWINGSQTTFHLALDPAAADELRFTIAPALNDVLPGTIYAQTSNANISPGVWTHLAVVFNGAGAANSDRLKLYVNGKPQTLVFTGTVPSTLTDSSASLQFAYNTSVGGQVFAGLMDEVAVFNTALSASTVLQHYTAGAAWLTTSPATLPAGSAQYLQYQARLSSQSGNSTPQLLSATVLADGYPSTSPVIQDDATTAPAYTSLGSFMETRGTTPGQGTISYRLSRNGTAWYFYNTTMPLLTDVPLQALVPTPGIGSVLNYDMGYEFVPLQTATITHLGGYWNGTHDVRLFQCVDAACTCSDPPACTADPVIRGPIAVTSTNAWAYVPITPLVVTAGQHYVLAAQTGTSARYYFGGALGLPLSVGPISVVRGRYTNAVIGGFPTSTAATTVYGLPDMKFDQVYGSAVSPWQPSLGVSQSNPASLISPKIGSFAKDIGAGSLYWQAYLTSNGTQPVELAQLSIGYDNSSFALTAPTAPTAWRLGDAQTIRWNKLGTPHGVLNVKLEYDPDGDFSAADAGTPQQTRTITASTANGSPADASCTASAGTGCFVWTIPTDPTYASAANAAKIRLTAADTGAEHVMATSPGFTVVQLDITAPALGTVWRLGSSGHSINWTASSALGNLAIEYNKGGGSWSSLNASASAAAGSWTWNIPSTPATYNSSSLRSSQVRLTGSVGGGTVIALSPGFTIAQVDVTAPAGGSVWRLGTSGNLINWTTGGPVTGNVVLTYAPDGNPAGANAKTIVTVPVSPGTYSWDIPGGDASYISATNAGVIQVAATVDGAPFTTVLSHVSPGITVAAPLFVISAPAAAEVVGISPPAYGPPSFPGITWTTVGGPISTNLKIEYSTDGGTTYTCNAAGDPGCIVYGNSGGSSPVTSPRQWFVVDAATSPTVKLRITDLNFPQAIGESAAFKVAGAITVTSPAASEKWGAGKDQQVRWDNTGLIPSVMVELFKNGTFFRSLTASTPSGPTQKSGIFSWRPDPTDASANATVRITNTGDTAVKALSGVFSITAVDVKRPVGGERWAVDSIQTLAWSHTGVANVALALSTDNGVTFPDVIAASVPATGASGGCTVPVGADGCFQWTVPDRVKSGQVKIRVQDADVTGAAQAENLSAGFTINGALDLLSPNGGESWASGALHEIFWSTPAGVTIPFVKLSYSFDDFASVDPLKVIVASITNGPNAGCNLANSPVAGATGCYAWTPRFTAANTVKVKVEDAQDPFTFDKTVGTFQVPGMAFSNPPPASALTLDTGAPFQIQWGTQPPAAVADVTLHYSVDDGATFPFQIATGIGNPGFYNWTVPDAIGTLVKLRVMSSANPAIFTVSDRFAIKSIPTLMAPNGGEVYDVGSLATIRWKMRGTVGTVMLELDPDGDFDPADTGAVATEVVQASAANASSAANGGCTVNPGDTGCYTWLVTDHISASARIRVSDADAGHPSASDVSNGPFTIRAAFTVGAPVGTDAWAVNEQRDITWTVRGTVPMVKIEYSTDGFACSGPTRCGVIAASAPSGSGSGAFAWTVKDLITEIVAAPGFGSVTDTHTRPVTIRISDADGTHPSASITSPAFTVKWYKITWRVLNSRNDQLLDSVRVMDQSTVPFWPGWQTSGDTVLLPVIHYYPATGTQTDGLGPYTTTWAKTNFVPYTLDWQADADKIITVTLEDTTPDPTVYTVKADYSYDVTADTLKVKTWVEKQGVLVKTGGLGAGKIELFDENSVPLLAAPLTVTPPQVGGVNDPAWDGTYEFLYGPPTNMVPARVYFMKATINAGGTDRTSGHTIQVGASGNLTQTDLQNALNPIGTQVGEIHTETVGAGSTLDQVKTGVTTTIPNLIGGVSGQVSTLQGTANTIDATTGLIKTETDKIQSIKTETDLISTQVLPGIAGVSAKVDGVQAYLADPSAGLPKIIDNTNALATQAKAQRRGGILNHPSEFEQNENLILQYRPGVMSMTPTLNVTDPAGNPVALPAMVLNAYGIYEATIPLTSLGQYRIVVDEAPDLVGGLSAGTVDSLVVTVREPKATATALSQLAASLTPLITELTGIEGRLQNRLDSIESAMATKAQAQTISDQVDTLVTKWGTYDAGQLMTELAGLTMQLGTAPAGSSIAAELASVRAKTDTIVWTDVTDARTAARNAETAAQAALAELGTGNIAAIRTATDTIDWADVTGLVTTTGDIKLKTDTIDWTQVTGIKTKTDTIAWGDVVALGTAVGQVQTDMAKDATVAKDAAVQSALAQLGTVQANLTALTATVNDPAQRAPLDAALVLLNDIRANMPTGSSDLSQINTKLDTLQTTLDTVPTGNVDLTEVTKQLASVEATVKALQNEQLETGSLMAKLKELQEAVDSTQGSSAAVGYSQSAFSAASEAVTLLHQLQTDIRQSGAGSTPPQVLLDLQRSLSLVASHVTNLPGQLVAEDESKQVNQIAEKLKALASEKGYEFDSLFELSSTQAKDVKSVKNNVEELKALLEVQQALLDKNLNQPVIKTWFEAGQ